MKCIIFFLLGLLPVLVSAQSMRLHVGGGFANYTGDIQQKRLALDQAKGVISFGASFDITDRIAVRVDYSRGEVAGDDKKNKREDIRKRNLNFFSPITEVALLGEYTFSNNITHPFYPYAFTGIGVFKFSPQTIDRRGQLVSLAELGTEGQGLAKYPDRKFYKKTQINIPFGFGLKYNLSDVFFVGVELGFRKIFTDYLDDLSLSYADPNELRRERGSLAVSLAFRGDELPQYNLRYPKEGTVRGNKEDDWYYFGQLRASLKLSWFNGFGGRGTRYSNKGALKRLGCPGRF